MDLEKSLRKAVQIIKKTKPPVAARLCLGLIFFISGLNEFLEFIEVPSFPFKAMTMLGGLGCFGVLFYVFKTP